MKGGHEWEGRTGAKWAAEWRRTDLAFSRLTQHLLSTICAADFAHVLDIGCGAGELSIALADRRPEARIVGVDLSSALVEVACERLGRRRNVEFHVGDASRWQPADQATPDLLVSRHGVMFFADPPAAFEHLRKLAAPDARLVFSCFRDVAENPLFSEVGKLLPPSPAPPDPHAPGPFAFADRAHVTRILEKGGWRDIAFEPFDFPMIAGAGDDPVGEAMAYFRAIGPAASVTADMPETQREKLFNEVREVVNRNLRDGMVSLGAGAWIITARSGRG